MSANEPRLAEYLAHMHGYFSVNLRTVWATIQSDLPLLKAQLLAARQAMA